MQPPTKVSSGCFPVAAARVQHHGGATRRSGCGAKASDRRETRAKSQTRLWKLDALVMLTNREEPRRMQPNHRYIFLLCSILLLAATFSTPAREQRDVLPVPDWAAFDGSHWGPLE